MPVYRIEIVVGATAYVRADSAEDASAMLAALDGDGIELSRRDMVVSDQVSISGRQYDDPELPAISLSPAMTLHTLDDTGAARDAELADE